MRSAFSTISCMAINVNVQYNGGLLPDIILLTQCYYTIGELVRTRKLEYMGFNVGLQPRPYNLGERLHRHILLLHILHRHMGTHQNNKTSINRSIELN